MKIAKGNCAGCGIPLSDGYTQGSDYGPGCRVCDNRRAGRLRRGELLTPTGFPGEAIDNTTIRGHIVYWHQEVA